MRIYPKKPPLDFAETAIRKNLIVTKEIYEYGNGIYAEPFWERVRKQMKKLEEEYEIIDFQDRFIPAHYTGVNCLGMKTHRCDELFRTVWVKAKE